jgi:hypothetical protein
MRKFLATRLCDDYTVEQMNPEAPVTEGTDPERVTTIEQINEMPEQVVAQMRVAVFEAIVDDIIEDTLTTEQVEDREKAVEDKVAPIVDKAVALHIVPASVKKNINELLAKHFKKVDPRKALLAKAAHFVMEAQTEVEEPCCDEIEVDQSTIVQPCVQEEVEEATSPVIVNAPEEVKAAAPAMSAIALYNKYMAGEITEQEMNEQLAEATSTEVEQCADSEDPVETTPVVAPIEVAVAAAVPEDQAAAMRYLAASAINHRSATVVVSRKLSGPLLNNMLHQLRYCLPKDFVAKYNVK